MLLQPEKSLCSEYQKIVVSEDKGSKCKHRASNNDKNYVKQYKLDGDIICNQTCCDYLLLNDTKKVAYFIELKGNKILDGIRQLECAGTIFATELKDYSFLYRLVFKKAKTHNIRHNDFRKFEARHRENFRYKEMLMEEDI